MAQVPTSSRSSSSGTTLLSDTTLSAAATTIDFSAISGGYTHLRLVARLRTDRGAATDNIQLRLNNDSGANYYVQYVDGNASGASAGEVLGATSAFSAHAPGGSATADRFGIVDLLIPFYAETTAQKAFQSDVFDPSGTGSGSLSRWAYGGVWASTAAVTRITLLPAVGPNFVAVSRAVLYGIT